MYIVQGYITWWRGEFCGTALSPAENLLLSKPFTYESYCTRLLTRYKLQSIQDRVCMSLVTQGKQQTWSHLLSCSNRTQANTLVSLLLINLWSSFLPVRILSGRNSSAGILEQFMGARNRVEKYCRTGLYQASKFKIRALWLWLCDWELHKGSFPHN